MIQEHEAFRQDQIAKERQMQDQIQQMARYHF
jgi:hypothetical protein